MTVINPDSLVNKMAASNMPPQTLVEELTDHLSCSICMEDFKQPKSLPCLHNFCKLCLVGYVTNQGFQDSFPCPMCQQKTDLTAGGIDAMTTNFFIMNIQDTIGTHVTDRQCDLCLSFKEGKKVTAINRCLQCCDFLCYDCSSGHTNSRHTHNHQVIPLADLANFDVQTALRSSQEVQCPVHPEEPVKYFCQQDKIPVCRDCIVLNHRSHVCDSLKEAADDYKKILQSQITSLQSNVKKYRDNIQTIDSHETDFHKMSSKVEQDIKSWAINTHKLVEEHENKLLAELEAKIKFENKSTIALRDENELKLGTLESTLQTGERVMKYGKDAELLFLQSQMTNRLNQIEQEPILPPFKTQTNITLQGSQDITATKLITQSTDAIQPSYYPPRPFNLLEKVELINILKQKNSSIYGVAVLPNSDIAIADCTNSKVKLFDIQGTLKWERTIDTKPSNVAVMSDGNIMVSIENNPKIDIFTNTGNIDRSVPTSGVCRQPGLAVDKRRLIQTNHDKKCFYICDLDGTLKSTIHNKQFKYPRYAACSNNGNIVISDRLANCVFLYSPSRELLAMYGTPGTVGDGPGKLNYPQGVCTDSNDNILVADYINKKVHLLTPQAKFTKYVLTPSDLEERFPRAIAITPQGYLVVTTGNGLVKIFKYTK